MNDSLKEEKDRQEIERYQEKEKKYKQEIEYYKEKEKKYKQELEYYREKEKKYKQELKYYKELQEEFNAIFQSSYDGIYIVDGKGVTLRLNPACERIEGIRMEEAVGKHMQELIDEGFYSESVSLKVLERKEPVTILQKVKNGKEVIATGTPVFKDGKIIRVVVNSRDITELNQMKRELREMHLLAEKYQSELELLRWEQVQADNLIVRSPEMKKVIQLALHVASVDSTVLIQGETGVGKDVISKFIHRNSKRRNGPFIKIDCSAIPETLLESELFGYEKGAFTGARKEGKMGLIELANEGTLFLDEIGELPLSLQAKLLRMIQDHEILRIGGEKPIPIDIRIISATNRNLKEMVEKKEFREDLYYRLNVVPMTIPPLRERKEDIYPLIMNHLDQLNKKYGLKKKIEPEALECLIQYDWPGNIRELENMIERLIVTTNTEMIKIENLPSNIKSNRYQTKDMNFDKISSLKKAVDDYEKEILVYVMEKSKNTQEMANLLGIDRSTVRRKLKKHKIKLKFKE